ncbi:MAG: hypothetical protein WAX14_20570 [Rhodococcus sp. (in: high G+C Gram-positive bacteria)]|uniref:hypothetical protein n=1 Tax=Rhodococcus sp. TaxID=1831 RepID=UPI003BB672FB
MLTVKEAVDATQTSESTVKRRLRAGAFPNAVQTADGKWMIPLGDLSAAGLRPGKMSKPDPVTPPADLARELAAENAELRQRLAVAEALASERNRIIEVQQQMLRMLEAKPAPAPAAPTPPVPVSATDAQSEAQSPTSVRGWLRRRFAG